MLPRFMGCCRRGVAATRDTPQKERFVAIKKARIVELFVQGRFQALQPGGQVVPPLNDGGDLPSKRLSGRLSDGGQPVALQDFRDTSPRLQRHSKDLLCQVLAALESAQELLSNLRSRSPHSRTLSNNLLVGL